MKTLGKIIYGASLGYSLAGLINHLPENQILYVWALASIGGFFYLLGKSN